VLARAALPFPREPVRTLDAIHLASAVLHAQAAAPLEVLSTDPRIRDSAVALGWPVVP
jgi:hypothetical protein